MRALHVIDSLSAAGGAEHGLVREITRFSDDMDQLVVCLYRDATLASDLERAGIAVEVLGADPATGARVWPWLAGRVRSMIKAFEPDVIQSSLFMGNLVGQVAGRSTKVPVVSTLVLSGDQHLLRRYQPGAASVKAEMMRRVAGLAARSSGVTFRAITQDAGRTNAKLLGVPPSRITVIPRGVPLDLRPDPLMPRAKLGLPEDVPLLVNIGRQTAQKGHDHLIDAFVRIAGQTDAHLVLCGREGDTTAKLHAMIEETKLADRVSVVGQTPLVHHYLSHASVFVFSSVMEGLGTAVLEAMSLSIPVVAFDIPPVREATDDGRAALLVPVGEADGFAAAVLEVLDGGHVGLADRGRAFVKEHRSSGAIADQVEGLLRSAALG